MNAVVLSPEEQISRIARSLLTLSHPEEEGGPSGGLRPELRGLITMLERHLEGDLPPLEIVVDDDGDDAPELPLLPRMLLGS